MTPTPPSCAMAMARRASVTVSMAEERMGILRPIELVTCVRTSAAEGRISEAAGTRSTSSKVSATPESRVGGP